MVRSVSVPFSTTITEATMDDMMTGMGMDEMGMDGMEPPVEEPQGFWAQLKNPNSWQMWAVVGGGCVVIILICCIGYQAQKSGGRIRGRR